MRWGHWNVPRLWLLSGHRHHRIHLQIEGCVPASCIDAIYNMDGETLEKGAKYEVR